MATHSANDGVSVTKNSNPFPLPTLHIPQKFKETKSKPKLTGKTPEKVEQNRQKRGHGEAGLSTAPRSRHSARKMHTSPTSFSGVSTDTRTSSMPLPAEAMPGHRGRSAPLEARTPGGSGEPGALPPPEPSSRAAAREDSLPLGSAPLPPRRSGGSARAAGRAGIVSSRSDADPAADLRHGARAALCRNPLHPGAARLAPPRPLPGLQEAVPKRGRGRWVRTLGASGSGSRRERLHPPCLYPVHAEQVPLLCSNARGASLLPSCTTRTEPRASPPPPRLPRCAK
ncbi:hypothetical protein MC885_013105 [Smutsia gigantea]|nr:hypothetical protein MC885_013105 [Smutsia gigantea]